MILQGNSFRIPLKDNSVHCAISSYPYFGLRDYGIEPTVWGGDPKCRHVWQVSIQKRGNGGERDYGSYDSVVGRGPAVKLPESAFCQLCNAWLGCFGLEPTIALHVQNAVLVSREVRRVLRPDGVFWLNYGDSYATSKNGRSAADTKTAGRDDRTFRDKPFSTANELPAKNLCMIPQRVAIALQEDGWIVRAAPQWIKRNPMPESVQDRPGNGHEYIFMLVKSERYFYDGDAVRRTKAENTTRDPRTNGDGHRRERGYPGSASNGGTNLGGALGGRAWRTSDFFFDSLDAYIDHLTYIRDNGGLLLDIEGLPEAFIVNPQPYKFAHYATFPPALVAPMVQSSTSAKGVCPKCGAAWVRTVEKEAMVIKRSNRNQHTGNRTGASGTMVSPPRAVTTGWQPSCKCPDNQPIPATILDPFTGSGTVGALARELGRNFIGIDLNPKYLAENALPRSERLTSESSLSQLPLFSQVPDDSDIVLEQAA